MTLAMLSTINFLDTFSVQVSNITLLFRTQEIQSYINYLKLYLKRSCCIKFCSKVVESMNFPAIFKNANVELFLNTFIDFAAQSLIYELSGPISGTNL